MTQKKSSKEIHVHIGSEYGKILDDEVLKSGKKKGKIIEDLLSKIRLSDSEISPVNFKDIKYSLKRIKTGIDGLNELLDGGFPSNFLIVVNGNPGSGKTIFGLQFLMCSDEESLLFTFEESASQLAKHAHQFGFNLAEKVKKNKLMIFNLNAVCVDDILEKITEYKPSRVVIDSVASIHDEEDHLGSWDRLLAALKKENITCLLITRGYSSRTSIFENRADGVIYLGMDLIDNKWKRYMVIRKMRATPIKNAKIGFEIGGEGVKVV